MYVDQIQKKKLKITAGTTISAGERASFHTILNAYYQTPNLEIKIAVVALGSDIMHAAFALAESDQMPAGPAYAGDTAILIGLLRDEITARYIQAVAEQQRIGIKPALPTGCDTSANARSQLLTGGASIAEEAVINSNTFGNTIGWPYHFATKIPIAAAGNDQLFIEDAVGKSGYGEEMANAHWSAHLYGASENHIAAQQYTPKCKFNQLSQPARHEVLTSLGLAIASSWSIDYSQIRPVPPAINPLETLTITVTAAEDVAYAYLNPGTSAEKDFLRVTADTVMDDLIIEDFAKRGYQRVNPALGMAGHRNILNDMEQNYSTNLNTNDIIYSIEDYYL